MRILGIETTCDETAAAVLEDGGRLVSSVVYSQIELHKKYNGVVPELASRAHAERVGEIIRGALFPGGVRESIDAVAFANGPGLPGALLVGRVAAETVARYYNVPVIGVNHLEGHLLACELEDEPLRFPLVALIVSGGHTELWHVKGYGSVRRMGATRDDAAGEAFDKVAKLLGLGYPGGPAVEKCALSGVKGNVKFPRPYMNGTWEFSFSGLKTAVSYYLRDEKNPSVNDVCAEFQAAVAETLVHKTILAAKKCRVLDIAVGGGVAANTAIREALSAAAMKNGMNVRFVKKKFCTDNGAMIALAGYRKFSALKHGDSSFRINPEMVISSWNRERR